ncbi:MAG: hypothetical protein M9894_22060 [Planctomycetes bacterium]|nr:hypothetical protein [Planctomycetota bacterium]
MTPRASARLAALALLPLLALATGRADEEPPPAADLVAPTPDLAAPLARFAGEAEPGRELKRAFVSVVRHVLAHDVDRALPYFHPDLRLLAGSGDLEPMPPARLEALLVEQREEARAAGERPRALADVLDLGAVRAYSRERAREVDAAAEGWRRVAPARLAGLMEDGDWLVVGGLRGGDLGPEVFYVFRRHDERFKVVLAE